MGDQATEVVGGVGRRWWWGGGSGCVVVGVWGGRVEEKREYNDEGILVILHQNKHFQLTEG